jgi:hypothetical protein
MFNAVQLLRDLNATGTSQAQNERIVMALQDLSQAPDLGHLATKDELKSEIALVRGDMALMKGELKTDIARLEGQIAGVKSDLRVWIAGGTAASGVIASLMVLISKAMHIA